MAGLPWSSSIRRIAVHLTGKLKGWTAPRTSSATVAGAHSTSGGTNAIIEYIGPRRTHDQRDGKATISNMGAEVGATTSLFPYDEHMAVYLQATGRGALVPVVEKNRHLLEPDAEVEAAPEKCASACSSSISPRSNRTSSDRTRPTARDHSRS